MVHKHSALSAMTGRVASRLLACAGIGSLALLGACSDDGTVTTLDANPEVSIPLPRVVFDSGVYAEGSAARDNLRPIVALDNGDVLSINLVGPDRYSGTITIETGLVYKVTVTWVEDFEGADLPLAEAIQDLAVGEDGSAELVQADEISYDTSLDFDSDGQSNLAERQAGTNPYGEGVLINEQTVADVIVPRISSADAPLIDGHVDGHVNGEASGTRSQGAFTGEWAGAVHTDMSGAELTISHLLKTYPARRWAAVHDGQYLYVLVVTDNSAPATENLKLLLNTDTFTAAESAAGVDIITDGLLQADASLNVHELKIDLQATAISTSEPFAMDLQFSPVDDGQVSDPTHK